METLTRRQAGSAPAEPVENGVGESPGDEPGDVGANQDGSKGPWLDRQQTYVVLVVALFIGFIVVRGVSWQGSAEFHTLMEVVATFLASMVGVMALIRHRSKPDTVLLLVGTGFLGTAFLDGYHAIVTSSWFIEQNPSSLDSLIPWSWVASRFYLSVLLFASWFYWRQESRNGYQVRERTIYLLGAGATLASFFFFALVKLPRAYYPEFVLHRPEELIPAVFFAAALIGYLRKGKWRHDPFEHWLVMALIVSLLSQTAFMSLSGQLFDEMFDAAHTLKKVSYILVLIGLLISMFRLYRQAEVTTAELMARTDQLEQSKCNLEATAGELRHTTTRLEASNRELEEFASVAAHDLQEPLRKIQAFGDRLEAGASDRLNDRELEFLSRMTDAAGRMRDLIDDLLQYSRISGDRQREELVDLDALSELVLSDLELRIEEEGAQIEFSKLPTVQGDPHQLQRLLLNLVGNALKYRDPDRAPVVRVHGELFEGAENRPGHWCRIVVTDNGIGFDQKYAERIFGVFERLHGKTKYGGTGIGLAICRRIAEQHGGYVTAAGTPDEGAVFTIELPIHFNGGAANG